MQELNQILRKIEVKTHDPNEPQEVALVYDRSKRDVGLLIRLYQLQRRITLISNFIGEWKPVSHNFKYHHYYRT